MKYGDIWVDPIQGHRVGCLDATRQDDVLKIMNGEGTELIINDPPYGMKKAEHEYMPFSQSWVNNIFCIMMENASLYVWLGAYQKNWFYPFPDFMIMMRDYGGVLKPKSFITMRNQRGYGTQKNWMTIRQELLYYVKGDPEFKVCYTDIPKVVKGYFKAINGKRTENIERSKSDTIRPGNVWMDIQQVFYKAKENVPECYMQKPLKAIERIIQASPTDKPIVDFFCHSGTTLIAGEKLGKKVYTFDIDPKYAEIAIERLKKYRESK